jgi:hypothetical protein
MHPMKAPEMVPAGRMLVLAAMRLIELGKALLKVARMEGLGLSDKADCAEVDCQSRGQEFRLFKEHGWTIGSIIPALGWSQHSPPHPMSCPPLK